MAWRAAGLVICLLVLAGCASTSTLREGLPEPPPAVEIADVPFHPDETLYCGPASLATVLEWSGVETTPEALIPALHVPERGGTLQSELVAQARHQGRLAYVLRPRTEALITELEAGHPVVVLQNLGLGIAPRWHYAVLVGLDPAADEFILRSGPHERHRTPVNTFLRTWARGESWALVVLEPGQVPASADPGRYMEAAHALEATGQQAAAKRAWQAGISRWPQSPHMAVALANLHFAQGDLEQAERLLRQALERNAGSGAVYNNLAWILAEQGQWSSALQMAEQAVAEGGPHRNQFRQTLETLREQAGDRAAND
ncbi:PA2778 family cysteine peptidase [Alkalilimnicola ehrlichii MLHE-1]|uniref:Tetratricopeptide TPR_4 n=1 Tax=Alkalilimnicola ehrlichii (strain ATCC BAA-1101 / DSM 17681 / MLHE-1) TaxID=187272 RepID=Q0ABA3_ALKEH|nr:PA2778 family cysteine peptidase [Alkalilimnicola ehrlichii]ABI55884.1 Tetratricopeptide TPR_4 [Alkalilimnicola ehrlichii MLHE-1]